MPRSTTAALLADPATPLTAATASAMEGRNASGAWSSLVAISRSLATAALAAAIVLALAATAPAQWSPGDAYNAVTLGSGEYFSTNDSYAKNPSSRSASIETWVKFQAGVDADMEIAESFDTIFNEGASLYAEWNGSNGYTVSMLGLGAFGNDAKTVTNATVMIPGQWYHVVGEFTATDLNVYVDGTGATPVSWGTGQGPSTSITLNRNTLGRAQNSGLASTFSGELTGFRIWDGSIGAPSEANSAVTATPNYAGVTLLANFQGGTDGVIPTTSIGNGSIDPNTGSTGGTLNDTNAANASVAKYGTGTIAVTTDSYFIDSIEAGVLDLGNGGTTGTLLDAVINNAQLSFNRSNGLTFGRVISGTGAVSQDGSGTTTLSVANTYSGLTSVNAGTLAISNASSLGTTAAGTEVASGATLQVNGGAGGLTLAESIGLNGGTLAVGGNNNVALTGTITLGTGTTSTFRSVADATDITVTTGSIAGAGNLIVGTSGNAVDALFLNGANTYTGTTTIAFGDVFITADGALGTAAGGTTVDSGSVLGLNGVNYATAEPLSLNGGTLDGVVTSTFAGPVTLSANSIMSASSGNTLTVPGVVDGGSNLAAGVSGSAGTVVLANDNTYSGATSVDFGTLQVGGGSTTGSLSTSGVSVASGATLAFNRSDAHAIGYAITGAGEVTVSGGGVATFSTASNYTGNTNVNAGGLNIASTLTSDVIVAAGATVSGSGSSTGELSGAGMVGPGNSPGILEFATLDASAGTDFSFEFTAADPDYSDATASVNDVLRLSDGTTPFTTALTSSSTVNIYLNVDSYTFGDEFRGGFFTDIQSDFITSIQDATFAYYLKDAGGAVIYNGVNYRNVTGAPGDWVLTTVPATANFAGGTVNGQVLQVVPEPSSFALAGAALAGLAAASHLRRRKAAAAKAAAQIAA